MKKALILVDLQNDFVDCALGTKEAQAIIPKVVEKIKGWTGDIFVTLDNHFEDTYFYKLEGKYLPWPHCIKFQYGWELQDDVSNAVSERIVQVEDFIEKETFGSLDLANALRDGNYDYIEFVGLCTDICVLANALLTRTVLPNTELAVDAACCAGVTPEKHDAALKVMESCQIRILNK